MSKIASISFFLSSIVRLISMAVLMRNEKWDRFVTSLGSKERSSFWGENFKTDLELYRVEWCGQSVVGRRHLQLYWFTSLFQLTVFQLSSPCFSQLKWWFVYCKHHWSSCATVTRASPSWWSLPIPTLHSLYFSLPSSSSSVSFDHSSSPCSLGLDVVEWVKGAGFWRASSHVQPGI